MKGLRYSVWLIGVVMFLGMAQADAQPVRWAEMIHDGWRFHQGAVTGVLSPDVMASWKQVTLPHTWNRDDAFDDTPGYYRGEGWYAKVLRLPKSWEGQRIYLRFEGVNQESDLYVNGRHQGSHRGGYTAFRYDITDAVQCGKDNQLLLRVDNHHNVDIPPLNADFTFYGGIYRNVFLEVGGSIHFDRDNCATDGVFVETPLVTKERATVRLFGKVVNRSDKGEKVVIESVIRDRAGRVVATERSRTNLGAGGVYALDQNKLTLDSPQLWSPENPYLYCIEVRLMSDNKQSKLLDELTLPLGIRWFSFEVDRGFFLNGEPYKLIGSNRHQDFEGLGNALPDALHRNDYAAIKALGCNFVRLAHYPQAPEVYRACDELGLLVWSEIPIVNDVTPSRSFFANCLQMQREHVRQIRNHPSVLLYGYMNEILITWAGKRGVTEEQLQAQCDTTVSLARQLNMLTKSEDPSRPTVMALHQHPIYNRTRIAEVADVVGWNLYCGWYNDTLEHLTHFLEMDHASYPKRPLIVSEYGSDADVRNHSFVPRAWDFSEDYQRVLHTSYLKQMLALPYVAGFTAWNFADFGAEGRSDARPFINQKGLVNYDRTPKDITYLYRAFFSGKPTLHIASRYFAKRSGVENRAGSGKATQPVYLYTNARHVELFSNGVSLGSRSVSDHQVCFEVPFIQGDNQLLARGDNETIDQLVIEFQLVPQDLAASDLRDLSVNVGAFQYYSDPLTKSVWMPDQPYVKGQWGAIGGQELTSGAAPIMKVGVPHNIVGSEDDPLFQTVREGIEAYRFDVADGVYLVTLKLVEYNPKAPIEPLIYNLTTDSKHEIPAGAREFSISANGVVVVETLNLARDYGCLQAVTIDLHVQARNGQGVQIDFQPLVGKTVLSGIRIRKQ